MITALYTIEITGLAVGFFCSFIGIKKVFSPNCSLDASRKWRIAIVMMLLQGIPIICVALKATGHQALTEANTLEVCAPALALVSALCAVPKDVRKFLVIGAIASTISVGVPNEITYVASGGQASNVFGIIGIVGWLSCVIMGVQNLASDENTMEKTKKSNLVRAILFVSIGLPIISLLLSMGNQQSSFRLLLLFFVFSPYAGSLIGVIYSPKGMKTLFAIAAAWMTFAGILGYLAPALYWNSAHAYAIVK